MGRTGCWGDGGLNGQRYRFFHWVHSTHSVDWRGNWVVLVLASADFVGGYFWSNVLMNQHTHPDTFVGLGRYLTKAPKPRPTPKDVQQALAMARK